MVGQAALDSNVEHRHLQAPDSTEEPAHGVAHEAGSEYGTEHSQSEHACDDCEEMGSGDHEAGCGTCAECCIGACAPPPVLVVNAVEEAFSNMQQFPISSFTGPIRARIERPPRLA